MDFANAFAILFLSLCYSKVYCRPQWKATPDPNTYFTVSKIYKNNRLSIGGTLGYSRKSGFGVGVKVSHSFDKNVRLDVSSYKSQHDGCQLKLGVSFKCKNDASVRVTYERSGNGGNKIVIGFPFNIFRKN